MTARAVAAAAVHCYTATGCVSAVLALIAAAQHDFSAAFAWIFLATIVDYTDGMLARWLHVSHALPQIDGAAVDSLTDFVANIVAPVFLLVAAGLWPWPQPLWVAAVILPSLYRFTIANPHRSAGFFLGLPPIFTFPAFYIFELRLRPPTVAGLVVLYAILCFVPFKYVHLTRFRSNLVRNGAPLLAWWLVYLVVTQGWTERRHELSCLSLGYFIHYGVISIRSARAYNRERHGAPPPSNSVDTKV